MGGLLGVGYLTGGGSGAIIALLVAAATNLFAYWNSDRMVLSTYSAHEVDRESAPEFVQLVAELASHASLPMPRVFVMDNPQPNAFATGRNPQNAAVAVTTGLMHSLSREELAGVIAHELAHVKNHDTLLMTITATVAGAISMLAQFGLFFGGHRDNNSGPGVIASIVMMILAPLAAMLVQMAISRTREYAADNLGARIAGRPMWLASALVKIESAAHQIPNMAAERNPATAHLFIINPLSGHGSITSLRRIRRPRTASPRCSSSQPNLACTAHHLGFIPSTMILLAVPRIARRLPVGHGDEVLRPTPPGLAAKSSV